MRELRDQLGEDLHDFGLQPHVCQGPSPAVLGGRGAGWGPVVGLAPAGRTGAHRVGTQADTSSREGTDALRPRWAPAPLDGAEATGLVRDLRTVVLDEDHALVATACVRLQPQRPGRHPPLLRRLHG